MNDKYEITCGYCMVTITGPRQAVDTAYRGHEKEAHGFMTGQEFYDRFCDQIGKISGDTLHKIEAMGAASRAAGLE